jgi:hypothetical protein
VCPYGQDGFFASLGCPRLISLLCVLFLQPFKYPDLLALLAQRDGMSMRESGDE